MSEPMCDLCHEIPVAEFGDFCAGCEAWVAALYADVGADSELLDRIGDDVFDGTTNSMSEGRVRRPEMDEPRADVTFAIELRCSRCGKEEQFECHYGFDQGGEFWTEVDTIGWASWWPPTVAAWSSHGHQPRLAGASVNPRVVCPSCLTEVEHGQLAAEAALDRDIPL